MLRRNGLLLGVLLAACGLSIPGGAGAATLDGKPEIKSVEIRQITDGTLVRGRIIADVDVSHPRLTQPVGPSAANRGRVRVTALVPNSSGDDQRSIKARDVVPLSLVPGEGNDPGLYRAVFSRRESRLLKRALGKGATASGRGRCGSCVQVRAHVKQTHDLDGDGVAEEEVSAKKRTVEAVAEGNVTPQFGDWRGDMDFAVPFRPSGVVLGYVDPCVFRVANAISFPINPDGTFKVEPTDQVPITLIGMFDNDSTATVQASASGHSRESIDCYRTLLVAHPGDIDDG